MCSFSRHKSVHDAKMILLGGDVERNPGPTKEDMTKQHNKVLDAIRGLSVDLNERHDTLLKSIDEVKENQKLLDSKVSNLTTRLVALEEKVSSLEGRGDESNLQDFVMTTVRSENAALRSRFDDYEDRSRKDNLVFYGINDCNAETWAISEEKVRTIISNSFGIQLPVDGISRAHRLGTFIANKCRPVIVRFASFKTRDTIFSQKAKLRGTGISVNEDFCKATRATRKKLLDFAKASGQPFSLKYNKVVIDKKTYTYCPITDSVCENEINSEMPLNNSNVSSGASASQPSS